MCVTYIFLACLLACSTTSSSHLLEHRYDLPCTSIPFSMLMDKRAGSRMDEKGVGVQFGKLANRKQRNRRTRRRDLVIFFPFACRWHSNFLFKNERPSLCSIFLANAMPLANVHTYTYAFYFHSNIFCLWIPFLFSLFFLVFQLTLSGEPLAHSLICLYASSAHCSGKCYEIFLQK